MTPEQNRKRIADQWLRLLEEQEARLAEATRRISFRESMSVINESEERPSRKKARFIINIVLKIRRAVATVLGLKRKDRNVLP